MNTYILQKDLPDVKAGAEFKLGQALDAYYLTSDKTGTKYNCYSYPKDFVENTPDWFKVVPDLDKPPLGLMPKYLHDEKRFEDIRNAMGRYTDAGKVVPQEWIKEEEELLESLKKRPNFKLPNEIRKLQLTLINKIQSISYLQTIDENELINCADNLCVSFIQLLKDSQSCKM